jgi:hypothetical protein
MADERLYLPRPVGLVTDHLDDLSGVYLQLRVSMEPGESLIAAVHHVFTPAESEDIISFFNGDQDHVFGPGSGEKLLSMVLGPWEQLHQLNNPNG